MKYLPLTAVLLAFWLGRETSAEKDGPEDVEFGDIQAKSITLVSKDEHGKYECKYSSSGMTVNHPTGDWATYSSRGMSYNRGLKSHVQINGYSRSIVIKDITGALRAVLGTTGTVNKKTGATTQHPESTLTLYDDKGNVLEQLPR